jgi:hypothetical protein
MKSFDVFDVGDIALILTILSYSLLTTPTTLLNPASVVKKAPLVFYSCAD